MASGPEKYEDRLILSSCQQETGSFFANDWENKHLYPLGAKTEQALVEHAPVLTAKWNC